MGLGKKIQKRLVKRSALVALQGPGALLGRVMGKGLGKGGWGRLLRGAVLPTT